MQISDIYRKKGGIKCYTVSFNDSFASTFQQLNFIIVIRKNIDFLGFFNIFFGQNF